jgi:hypothetical protein
LFDVYHEALRRSRIALRLQLHHNYVTAPAHSGEQAASPKPILMLGDLTLIDPPDPIATNYEKKFRSCLF